MSKNYEGITGYPDRGKNSHSRSSSDEQSLECFAGLITTTRNYLLGLGWKAVYLPNDVTVPTLFYPLEVVMIVKHAK